MAEGEAEPLQWEIELDAKLDGAKSATDVLERLDSTLKKLDGALDANARKTQHDGDEHEKHAKKARTLAHELEELNHKLKELTAFTVFEFGFDKALELAKELVEVTVELGKEIINAAAHEERINKSFEFQLGKESAEEVLEYLDMLGTKTEFVDDETKKMGQTLIKSGFAVKDLPHAMAAIADLAAFSSDKMEGSAAAVEALTRIMRTGVVDNRALKPFGLGEDQLVKTLQARGVKGDADAIKEMISKGKIDREQLLQAVYQTITDKTGKLLGGAGAEMGQTLEARLHRLKNLPEMYFEKWAKSPGFQIFSDRIDALFKRLDPESPDGARIFAALERVLDTLTGAFEDFLTPEGIDNFIGGLKAVIDAVGALAKGLREIVNLMNGETISKALNAGEDRGSAKVREIDELHRQGETGGYYNSLLDSLTPSEKDDLARLAKKTGAKYGAEAPNFAPPLPAAGGVGFDIVGLDSLGARESAEKAGRELGKAHEKGVREELDMHSPSKKLEQLGRFASMGFAEGIAAGSSFVEDAFDSTLAAPSLRAAGARAGGFGGGLHVTVPITIEMHGGSGDDAEAIARRIEEIVPSSIVSALEQFADELGAGAPEGG